LAGTIGLPFFVLSTSASVFQHWLSRTDHPSGRDPYFLYASSNFGCVLALASYPVLVEPVVTLSEQTRLWSMTYAAFAVLAGGCAAFAWRHPECQTTDAPAPADARREETAPITWLRRGRWIALSLVPSSLMLAVTSHISTDVAAIPLLWIVPLGIYLLTFAIAFGRHSAAAGALARRALPLLVVPLAVVMVARVIAPLGVIVALHLSAFAVIALNCHAELAKDRPDASSLTEFYFWVSLGGMLGGLFNTLAAPVLFNGIIEYPLMVVVACLLFRAADVQAAVRRPIADVLATLAVAASTAAVLLLTSGRGLTLQLSALTVPAVLTFAQRRQPGRFGLCIAALLAVSFAVGRADERTVYATRTFFGVYRVSEDTRARYHALAHGTTLHGIQALAPERRHEALTYFHQTGPFGQAWRALPAAAAGHEIAVIGLGIGTLSSYARPEQRWTFFEIDPAIERIARTPAYFSFMDACGDRCRVVIGDARISLGRVPEHAYDVLVIDAFSSDSIPMHLMTREAFALYRSRLAPGGVLVMHISNRHLRLAPVVARLAASQKFVALQQLEQVGPDWPEAKSPSHWVVMASSPADLGTLTNDPRWSTLMPSASTPLWTDDFSNILSVLALR
jgi:spermidine synthase